MQCALSRCEYYWMLRAFSSSCVCESFVWSSFTHLLLLPISLILPLYNNNISTKMKEPSFTLDDYSEIHSSKGIMKLPSSRDSSNNKPNVFSAACANGNILSFLLNEEKVEEEVVVTVVTTQAGEGRDADNGTTASLSMGDTGPPWMIIIIALVCGHAGIGLIAFLVRRSVKKEKSRRRASSIICMDSDSEASFGCTLSPSMDVTEKKEKPRRTLLGLFYKRRVSENKNSEMYDIEAGMESGEKLDDDKPMSNEEGPPNTTDVSGPTTEESGKDDDAIIIDEEADKNEKNMKKEETAGASTLEVPHSISLSLDSSDSGRSEGSRNTKSKRSSKASTKKSNSDFGAEASQSKRDDTVLRRSVCDLDIGTKRMKDDQELSTLLLEEIVKSCDNDDKNSGDGNRGHRRTTTADSNHKTVDDTSDNKHRKRCAKEHHRNNAKYTSNASSRRKGRKHDPLRRSIDDSNIGLRSGGTIYSLNNVPKKTRRKSRKPDPLRRSQDDSNIGLRTARAVAAKDDDAKKTVRRKKGRRQDQLRRSRCDLDIGTKRQVVDTSTLNDRSSKSERRKHDHRTKGEKRPVVKRSLSE
jgi:hypothetical protein